MVSSNKRLYISADIEGVAGMVSKEQASPTGFEYQEARAWMTGEVLAACNAAFEQGFSEVVVSDSHGNGQNLLLDEFPENVQIVRCWPRPLCMMEGIDIGHYAAALLIGYHSGATSVRGVLAHTFHGGGISEVRLNGQVASETVFSAATAAHFGVPIIMVSGDDTYTEHATSVLGNIETVTTKWACSYSSARSKTPKRVQRDIYDAVIRALSRLSEFEAKPLCIPIQLDVQCARRFSAELLSYLPIVEQLDAYSIRYEAPDMVAASTFISFLLASGVLTAN